MLETITIIILCLMMVWQYFTIDKLRDQLAMHVDTILSMAEELQQLGSPNVKIFRKDSEDN
jgi:hypothetical protein